MKVPSAESFETIFGLRREKPHAVAPARPTVRRKVFQHAGVLQDERDLGRAGGKFGCALHLAGKNLEVEGPAIVGKVRDVFLQRRIARKIGTGGELILRVLVPLQLHPQPAHAAIFGQAVELRPHVVRQKVGIADDGLRKSGFVGGLLHVGDFVLEGDPSPNCTARKRIASRPYRRDRTDIR